MGKDQNCIEEDKINGKPWLYNTSCKGTVICFFKKQDNFIDQSNPIYNQ